LDKVYNWLRPNAFRFSILDIPNVSFTVQSVNLPSINSQEAVQPTPFLDLPRIGDKLTHSDLTIKFIVNENMDNYLEIYDWMTAIGFPNNYSEFSTILSSRIKSRTFAEQGEESLAYSDLELTILDSDNNPNIHITYKDSFPVNLSDIFLDVSSNNTEYVTCTATFKFSYFNIKRLN
jgi:hypothetical protein